MASRQPDDGELQHLTGPSAPALWRYSPLRLLLAIGFATSVSFNILLSAVPLWAAHHVLNRASAGIPTTVMLIVTISAQPFIPALVKRFGSSPVQAAGLLALGLPAPFYGLTTNLSVVLVISAVRGFGFAVLTIVATTLGASLVPGARHGESVALFGLATALPAVVGVPIGVALTQSGHFTLVAAAGAMPVLAVPLVFRLKNAPTRFWAAPRSGYSRSSRLRAWARMGPPALCLFVITLAAGGLTTYLPIEWQGGRGAAAALLLVGCGGLLGKWWFGVKVEPSGHTIADAAVFRCRSRLRRSCQRWLAFRVHLGICGYGPVWRLPGRCPESVGGGYLRSCSCWLRIDRKRAVECELRRRDGSGSSICGIDRGCRARHILRCRGYRDAYRNHVPASA